MSCRENPGIFLWWIAARLGTGPHPWRCFASILFFVEGPAGASIFCLGLETVGMLRFSPLMANRNLEKPIPPVACTRADAWDIRIYMPIMDGWKTIVSFWDGLLAGANCQFQGFYSWREKEGLALKGEIKFRFPISQSWHHSDPFAPINLNHRMVLGLRVL